MSSQTGLADLLDHPLTALSAIFAAVAHLFSIGPIDAVAATVWSQASTLFTVASVGAFTLAPNIPTIPAEPLRIGALIIGGVYVLKLGDKFLDQLQRRLDL